MKNNIFKGLILLTVLSFTGLSVACDSGNSATNQVIKVQKGDIAVTVACDGNLTLIKDRKLTFQTSGLVNSVNVIEGDRVKAGDVLARIDTESIELNMATAELAVKAAALDLQIAQNNYEKITYPYSFSTFNISVPDSLNAMNDAQRNLDEISHLIGDGVTSDELFDLRQNIKKGTDALTLARDKLKIITGQNPFGSQTTVSAYGTSTQIPTFSVTNFWVFRETELAVNKAELGLEKAENDLQQVSDQLSKTVIKAPFDGLIAQVNIKEGDNLSGVDYSSKVAFYLIDPESLEMRGTVDEIDVAKITVGQKAEITLDALPDNRISGELTYITSISELEGGVIVYEVKIKLENGEPLPLKPGMTAKADIVTQKKKAVLIVPDRAINRSGENTTVKIMVDGKLQDKPVVPGITDGINTEILSGLTESEEIIIEKKG